jgi:hypothetical protein
LRIGGEVSCWYRINNSEDYSNEIQVPWEKCKYPDGLKETFHLLYYSFTICNFLSFRIFYYYLMFLFLLCLLRILYFGVSFLIFGHHVKVYFLRNILKELVRNFQYQICFTFIFIDTTLAYF